jgi:hypothetical protein
VVGVGATREDGLRRANLATDLCAYLADRGRAVHEPALRS